MEEQQEQQGENTEVVQESPVEVEAKALGWKPKEEFEAEERNAGKKWRTAEDFMDRKSLFDKIESLHEENKRIKKGLQEFANHNARIEQVAYERALADLKAQRKAALEDNDLVRAEEIRDEMDEVRARQQSVKPAAVVQDEPPPLKAWKSANRWYGSNEDMTAFADGLANRLTANGTHPDEILQIVSERVKTAFPQAFRNPNKDTAPEMVGSSKRSSGKAPSSDGMTEDEERILKTMLKAGAPITREEYIAQIKKARG